MADHPSFEREKWQDEVRLRERELTLRERDQKLRELELRLKRRDEQRSRWGNPLVLAVFAAALAAFGNAAVALINGIEQRELQRTGTEPSQALEETKAEATRILEVIKTNDVPRARSNLEFLTQTGLITNSRRRADIQAYLSTLKPGEGPSLPSSTALLQSLGLNEGQIRAAEKILQEAGVPPEQQASKIIEIARKFGELGSSIKSLSGTDPFYKKVSDAIEGGDLKLAEELLNERVEKSRNEAKRAQDEMKRISEQLEENKKEQMKLKDNRGQ